jgi:YD repeat-containing protein
LATDLTSLKLQSVTSEGTTRVTSFTVDSDDEVTAASSSSGGLNNSYSYNSNGEQTGRTLAGTAYTAAFDYDGQMTSLTQGSSTTTFAYDALGRRVSRTAGGTTTAFQYDGGSVLLEKQGSTTTGTYTYGVGLVRKDGETPLYDGIGSARAETNSSQSVTSTLTPDAFGNAVATTGSTGSSYQQVQRGRNCVSQFLLEQYNSNDLRVQKIDSSGTRNYISDGNG